MKLKKTYLNFVLGLVLTVLLTQAKCDNNVQNIPYVPVNLDINLNLPAYNDLNFVSNHIYVNGGSKGLIIYRYTQDIFVVLDRHSTSDIELGCTVSVDDDGLLISDHSDCSESKWLIIDGTVNQGTAILPLHRYGVNWNPPVLSIFN